ncbi:MAG: hypothetical protein J7L15_05350 [Clostridiales bacterium]|nr:hypothetical protein [Clostridiales bacterium]
MTNWTEHYVKQEQSTGGSSWATLDSSDYSENITTPKQEHIRALRKELAKVHKELKWYKPWVWYNNSNIQKELINKIENHKKIFPEYYL